MKIVICGWYFDDDFYQSIWIVKEKYPVFIVAHRENELLDHCDLDYIVIENKGLEWGAYNHFLMKVWDGNDSVLFMHDDLKFNPIIQDYEIKPGEIVFRFLGKIQHDHAYIFQNRREEVLNFGNHGRMVIMSERLLHLIKKENGFPFDHNNKGYTGDGEKPKKTEFHNYGIMAVSAKLKEIQQRRPGWTLMQKVYTPNIDMGYRGKFNNQKETFLDNLSMKI